MNWNYLTLASNQNFSNAQTFLGYIYYEGKYIARDIDRSIYYFSLSANLNNQYAQFLLGKIYYDGEYVTRDINKSINYLMKSAKQDNSFAQYLLGKIFSWKNSLNYDINKSLNYLNLSVKNNNRWAQLLLADLYLEGIRIKRNVEKAFGLYKEVSSFNNQFAKNNLGVIYKYGFCNKIKQNKEFAKEYFNEAIKQKNDILSMYNLSNILFEEEKFDESLKLLIKCVDVFYPAKFLFCLLIINKLNIIDYDKFLDELKNYNLKSDLFIDIFDIIYMKYSILDCKSIYESFRNSSFIYIEYNYYLQVFNLDEKRNSIYLNYASKLKNINKYFYEGFG